jgi:hypothetical protein
LIGQSTHHFKEEEMPSSKLKKTSSKLEEQVVLILQNAVGKNPLVRSFMI